MMSAMNPPKKLPAHRGWWAQIRTIASSAMALREAGMSGSIIVCTQARAAADGLNSGGGDVMIYQWSRLTLYLPAAAHGHALWLPALSYTTTCRG